MLERVELVRLDDLGELGARSTRSARRLQQLPEFLDEERWSMSTVVIGGNALDRHLPASFSLAKHACPPRPLSEPAGAAEADVEDTAGDEIKSSTAG